MQYRIIFTYGIFFGTSGDSKTKFLIEPDSLFVLLVYIDFCDVKVFNGIF